ncbi:hypothetical protein LSH36_497g01020 [Paralvinella palmiformis]|uniref:Uncharacterized protein n=1 Tax=Paralvinella palmiformis TaxID=53620 RepID=A0AAD9J8J2_9ANNE|nr:hypothetical protein LSH36_497g01020 [Paralvinella palmiformis]
MLNFFAPIHVKMHQFIVEDALSCSDVECFRQEMNNKETTNDPEPPYSIEEDSSGSIYDQKQSQRHK